MTECIARHIRASLEAFFKKRGMRAENIKGFLLNNPETKIFVDNPDNIGCVFFNNSGMAFFDCVDPSLIEAIAEFVENREGIAFCGIDKAVGDAVIKRYSKEVFWINPCDLYYYPFEAVPKITLAEGVLAAAVTDDAPTIDAHYTYRSEGSLEAITEDILRRPSSAIYVDGKIVSWCVIHPDNSMGIMFTLPIYRRMGFSQAVTFNLIGKVLASGNIPYVHIVDENSVGKAAVAKLGMRFSHPIYWFGMRT